MRDLLVYALVFGTLPFILTRPWFGILVWSWLGYMNPHRMGWNIDNAPFALIVGIVTLASLVISRDMQRLPMKGPVIVLLLLNLWMLVTTFFSFFPDISWVLAEKVFKIQLMIFVSMMVINSKDRIIWLVWVIALSIGFFGFKGGLFTLATAGSFMVLGPAGTYIAGNTEISLALAVTLPLLRFLQLQSTNKWVRHAMTLGMILSGFAIVGSYSRGALLAGGAMAFFLWWKGRNKLPIGLALICLLPLVLMFMPDQWWDKMGTIQTYEEDSSAMGRINAWWFAVNLAKDYPLTGCGFNCFTPELFLMYAPEPEDFHSSHSIYFQVLGHHGYVGLFLYLLFYFLVWRTGTRIRRLTRDDDEWHWAYDLASMIQVSLVGFAVGGAFLGLAYFDLPYHLAAILVLVDHLHSKSTSPAAIIPQAVPAGFGRRGPGPVNPSLSVGKET